MPRDRTGALIFALRKKILGLLREMVFPPRTVAAISAEAQGRGEHANSEAARPPPEKIAPLQGADIAEAILIFGILHCVEESKRLRGGTSRPRRSEERRVGKECRS